MLLVAPLTILLPASPAHCASAGEKPAATEETPRDPHGRDTPRSTMLGFMKAASGNDFKRAALFVDTRRAPRPVDQRLRELFAVLNQGLSAADIDSASNKPAGEPDDAVQPDLERVGEVKTNTGSLEIMLQRFEISGQPPHWRISAETFKHVSAVHAQMQPYWFERFLWTPLREGRYLGMPLWQWIALPMALLLVFAIARLLGRGVFLILRPLTRRLPVDGTGDSLAEITGPIRLAAVSLALLVWLNYSGLPLLVRLNLGHLAVALGIAGLAWLIFRLVDIVTGFVVSWFTKSNKLGGVTVVQLIARLSKVMVFVLALLTLLYHFGVDLTTALAGLGIGGLAIAFAAQKTLENLFGGLTIIADQPVRVGDFCKVGGLVGTVESIGLRSTRIRTLDRTVVSVPNAQMASENLENYGFRDKVWFRPTLNLRYETRADQLRYVLAEIRRMFYEHPMVESASARIRFVGYGNSSLDLEVFAYVLTGEFAKFLEVQEDLLLRIMDIVEKSGTGFAFPSSTTYLARDSGLDPDKTREAIATVGSWREANQLPFPNYASDRIAEFAGKIEYPPAGSAVADRSASK